MEVENVHMGRYILNGECFFPSASGDLSKRISKFYFNNLKNCLYIILNFSPASLHMEGDRDLIKS